jgi:hypothetical protein
MQTMLLWITVEEIGERARSLSCFNALQSAKLLIERASDEHGQEEERKNLGVADMEATLRSMHRLLEVCCHAALGPDQLV